MNWLDYKKRFEPFDRNYPILLKQIYETNDASSKVTDCELVVTKFHHNITELKLENLN